MVVFYDGVFKVSLRNYVNTNVTTHHNSILEFLSNFMKNMFLFRTLES